MTDDLTLGFAAVLAKWMPMSGAPRDGTWFWARSSGGQMRAVHFADNHDRYPIAHDGVAWETAPAEWTHLSRSPETIIPDLIAKTYAMQDQIEQLEQDLSDMRDNAESAYRRGYYAGGNGA